MNRTYSPPSVFRWSLFGLSLAIAGWTGWQMMTLPLWGYLPLWFLLGAYGTILAVFAPRILRHREHIRDMVLSSLTGVMLWLGFPDMPLTILMFGAFVPLLLVEDRLQTHFGWRSVLRFWFYSYHAFLLWNILSTFWVANTAFVAGIFANFVNAFLMTIPLLGYHWLRHSGRGQFRWAGLVSFWMMFEMLHLHWELTWPFLSLGNALAQYPSWAQWYEYTGMLGGTVWILAGNTFLYGPVKAWLATRKTVPSWWIIPILWIAIPLLVSVKMYHDWQPDGRITEVVVIQPNYEPHYEKFEVSRNEQLRRIHHLAATHITPQTRYLVMPETTFGGFDLTYLEEQAEVQAFRRLLDSFPHCAVITGIDPYRFLESGEVSPVGRPYTRNGDTLWWEASNMAIQISQGQEAQHYYKGKLVPGAEIYPYQWLFFFMEPLVDQLGGSLQGLRRSEERKAFKHGQDRVGPVICYESVFGEYCTGYVHKGAQALAIITNDGWWDDTPGHRQHLLIGTLRAIETRRDIIRSANTGISCIVDQRGDIHHATGYEETVAFRADIRLREGKTVYVAWGDYLGRMALFVAVILLCYGLIVPFRRKWARKV